MADPDESYARTLIETIRKFATELAELKQEEQKEREDLMRQVDVQMTALRQDFYGSILYLDQQVTAIIRGNEEHRAKEREARQKGQRWSWRILGGILAALLLILALFVGVALKLGVL